MGVLGFFKKRKSELSHEQKKWNKMWELWAENRADTPLCRGDDLSKRGQ